MFISTVSPDKTIKGLQPDFEKLLKLVKTPEPSTMDPKP
jgi:hypothetical protein